MAQRLVHLPAYKDGSIVNLMSSIQAALGVECPAYAPLPQLEPDHLGAAGDIVFIVIDGLGYHYLRQQAASTLRQHVVARITSVFPSTTASAVTTFFTGTAPQQHGITGWFMYFKELGAVVAPLPFRARAGGASLNTWGVAASRLFDRSSVFEQLVARCYIVLPQHICDSEYTVAHSGPAERRAYGSLTQCFQCIEEILRTSDERKYIYAYSPELDNIAHTHGIGSTEVAAHFEQLDAQVTSFLKAIEGSGTTVVITGDHGLIDSAPDKLIRLEDHPELTDALVLPLCGEPRVAFCYVHPHKQQQFESYVRDELGEYAMAVTSQELFDEGFFGVGEPNQRLLDRIGHYALIMKDRYVIKDWVLGERRYVHVGVHGGVSEEEMYVPLVIVET